MAGVSIRNLTRRSVAGLPFAKAAEAALPGWDISLVFAGPAKARALNKELRKKDYTPNVLSYVAGEKSGEIIICPAEAKKQAGGFSMSESDFLLYLFIHGLLHIKGQDHGATMERSERRLLARFAKGSASATNETPHRNGNRHRHLSGEDRRRRGGRR